MALNYQSSTLSLTLPISCQICLGKVKQPVICANYHVFCSSCMEMWLKKAGQCPTCRVPITTDSPCREIIGGSNEGDHSDSPTVKKCLRKTRGELLLREYEEEIEGLMRENEELKAKNQTLETQLKTALHPSSIATLQGDEKRVSPHVVEEWKNKLQAATDVCDKIKQDMDKSREANKVLRSQNVNLVQENMRLKTEVASRSPQKFGRYTVAALEAKCQLYERDLNHLKRALERSDQYVDELESRISKFEKSHPERQEACGEAKTAECLTQQQRLSMMMRSLSDEERKSICSNPEEECQALSGCQGLVFASSGTPLELKGSLIRDVKKENSEKTSVSFSPATPSSAFQSLTLRSPGLREKRVTFKPITHQRRLDFEEVPSSGKMSTASEANLEKFPKGPHSNDTSLHKSAFWSCWEGSRSNNPSCLEDGSDKVSTSTHSLLEEPGTLQMTSEASMNAAFLDKISELDSMMLDGESSSSHGSHPSLESFPTTEEDKTLIADSQDCSDISSSPVAEQAVQEENNNLDVSECTNNIRNGKDIFPESSDDPCSTQKSSENGTVSACPQQDWPCQSEELSFDLLFDATENTEPGPSGSLSSMSWQRGCQHVHTSSSCACEAGKPASSKEKAASHSSQPVKRKSHSPFCANSPTKLSKLM